MARNDRMVWVFSLALVWHLGSGLGMKERAVEANLEIGSFSLDKRMSSFISK